MDETLEWAGEAVAIAFYERHSLTYSRCIGASGIGSRCEVCESALRVKRERVREALAMLRAARAGSARGMCGRDGRLFVGVLAGVEWWSDAGEFDEMVEAFDTLKRRVEKAPRIRIEMRGV